MEAATAEARQQAWAKAATAAARQQAEEAAAAVASRQQAETDAAVEAATAEHLRIAKLTRARAELTAKVIRLGDHNVDICRLSARIHP